jgi:BirA family biotin operon repressor/biotin-[acetyl-CoA-carboxylase] ligase
MKIDPSEILTMLRESSGYVSGQEICDKYKVSRTAVWKYISQLRDEGYSIEAVRNKGYRLADGDVPDVLNEAEITSRLTTKWVARTIQYLPETGSTNNDAAGMADAGGPSGLLATAGAQNAGKGRRGRVWKSPSGTTVAMSIALKPDFAPEYASMLTLVSAHSTLAAIEDMTGVHVGIKWPNDLVINGRKICGILTEMSAQIDFIQHVVIGIGVNVNQESRIDFPEDIRETATSLRIETGRSWNRAEVIARTMNHFEEDYASFAEKLDMGPLLDDYNAHLVNLGQRVRVLDPKGEYNGTAHGINKKGELIVEREDGSTVNVYAGEVSVRGIYGYV